MKTILIFAPESPHTEKYVRMIEGQVNYILVAGKTDLAMRLPKYNTINQRKIKGILTILKNLWFTKHDYVHVHSLNFTALVVALFAIKPIIVTAWGSDILLVPNKSRIHRLITQFILWRAETITANDTDNMKKAIYDLMPDSDKIVRPIHFGVSQESKRVPFSQKENIIYSPRGHADLYNIDKVIEAFRRFSFTNPNWKLVISGMQSAVNTSKLKEQAKGLPVFFAGWITAEQHADWNTKAKIVVSIPSSDALSVTIMEAIYSNCIVFASDLQPNRSVILEGKNGFISDAPYFSRWKEIDIDALENINGEISKDWTFEANKKKFLELYI